MDSNEQPIALEAFEKLARSFSERAGQKAENAFIEQPCTWELIGSVAGLRVLDAGCGPGLLASWLIEGGAAVTGFDVSPTMIKLARERLGERARLHLADMAKPLSFVAPEEFDLIVSSLAIDYVRDWKQPLSEFYRSLKPGGRLVFSVQHPMGSYKWYRPTSAFGVQYVEAVWRGFGEHVVVPDYYRPFEEIVNPVLEAGFTLLRVRETKPVERLREVSPEDFERCSRFPTFMCLEASKTPLIGRHG